MIMQPGSIVVCVLPIVVGPEYSHIIKWLPVQDSKTPYMIRGIGDFPDGKAVTLEEGVVGVTSMGEVHILIECFRELLPPEDLTEFIEECCCVPMEPQIETL